VANYFDPPGQPPAYGRFLSELLSRTSSGFDFELLDDLSDLFSNSGADPVARLLELALGDSSTTGEARFREIASQDRLVWSEVHAALFQREMRRVLAYRSTVSRRTFVGWLYAVLTFFLSTYFLRMAAAAQSFSECLEGIFGEERAAWNRDIDSIAYAPRIAYGHRDQSHSRLLKRFPFFTSQIEMARAFARSAGGRPTAPGDLSGLSVALLEARSRVDSDAVFLSAAERYPTGGPRTKWKLSETEKGRIISLARESRTEPFVMLTQNLNFEDMARRSNNVMEWQFYASLARHQDFGFAQAGRTGDVLRYRMTEHLLVALAHCHLSASPERAATLETFVEYLKELGFEFDGEGRSLLETQLAELGMLEGLSDASDAKYLNATYSPAPESSRAERNAR
jgi:peptidoglycan/xylan/chitin deacetylase (PgdA/CDA1 family)